MPWRREWLPTPVFWPGEFYGQRSLAGYSPWDRKESDTTEQLSLVQIWQFYQKEGWALKNWCFRIMVLEKSLENPLVSKEIKPVNPKVNRPWIFIGKNDAETKVPPDVKSQLIGKDPNAGKDWGQKKKGVTEDEMVGWHHRHDFEQSLGNSEGQGSLVCCSPCGCIESVTTWWLNNSGSWGGGSLRILA